MYLWCSYCHTDVNIVSIDNFITINNCRGREREEESEEGKERGKERGRERVRKGRREGRREERGNEGERLYFATNLVKIFPKQNRSQPIEVLTFTCINYWLVFQCRASCFHKG